MDFGGEPLLRRSEVLAQGLTDRDIRAAVERGEIEAILRGVYAQTTALAGLTRIKRHRLEVRAALLDSAPGTAAGFDSAAVMHGLGVWKPDLSRVHLSVARTSGGHVGSRVHLHAAGLTAEDIVDVLGVPVTSPARTVADLARTSGFEQAVCVGDSALKRGLTTVPDILKAIERTPTSRKKSAAEKVLDFLDGRSESVGESRSRVYLNRWGVPEPELQVTLCDEYGNILARPDFLWEDEAALGEFDGMSKYAKYLRPGEKPEDVLEREKRREDELRAHGWAVVRWTWRDLATRAIADRIVKLLKVKRPRPSTFRRLSA